jgi:hypothetical protein
MGISWLDQDAASKLSTQYSFSRPASIRPDTAPTMPLFSKSHARPCSDGNPSTGRPQCP